MLDDALRARIVAWRDDDPDSTTVAATDALLHAADAGDEAAIAELGSAFGPFLTFGTAGLRGAMGPGPARMNRAVVSRAAAGIAQYLLQHNGSSAVVGYDARHRSLDFAIDTAEILSGAGVRTFVMPTSLPTPLLAFAIRVLEVDAGIMVTASHNPAQDNGYKVYLGDGSQIIPPNDRLIADEIARITSVATIARGDDFTMLTHDIVDAYVNAAASIVAPDAPRAIRVVSTSMHGVGHEAWMAAMRASGFRVPSVVLEQAAPDPEFPTVAFPNPEEAGAADMLLTHAATERADIAIAHDPDADRCAVGVFDPRIKAWRLLTGDELGTLLAWWAIERTRRFGLPMPTGVLANSIVSSTALLRLAESAGLRSQQTLTGFKWIARVPELEFGYEEALGYCVAPQLVADKDGITAGLRIAELAAALKAEGRTLLDALDGIYSELGLHATTQLSLRIDNPAAILAAVDRLRTAPPAVLAGEPVLSCDDLALGVDGLPPTEGIRLRSASMQVIVRPSGTEPKLKCYLQFVTPFDGEAARDRATHVMATMQSDLRAALGI